MYIPTSLLYSFWYVCVLIFIVIPIIKFFARVTLEKIDDLLHPLTPKQQYEAELKFRAEMFDKYPN